MVHINRQAGMWQIVDKEIDPEHSKLAGKCVLVCDWVEAGK